MLPAPLTSFVGRADERVALDAALAAHRLVTLVGLGGCGKSRLAVEVARGHPLLGFVELSPVGPQASLPLAVLASCDVRDDPSRAAADRLAEHLRASAGLLVLDNCEHVRAGVAALVADLLRRCPGLAVLATSRVALGVVGEATVALGGMAPDDAAALFLARARLVQPGLAAGPEAVAEICRLADGLPLAIELAAARARTLPLPAIRAGMADRVRFLGARDGAVHRSLAASLDRSAELVGPSARAALGALSLVDGRFPLDVALALTGGDREAVETLVDHSLVQLDAADGRYKLLDTVRAHAAARATGTAAAVDRLLDWAVAFAREVRDGLERADPDALRRADACDAAVATALDRAAGAGRGADGAAVATDLAFAWSLRGRCAEGRDRVERLAAALQPVPAPLQWARAFLATYGGDVGTGFALAAAAAGAAGDDRTRARALTLQGLVLQFADPAAAEAVVTEAAALAERAGDAWCRVEALQLLAYTHLLRADPAAALAAADAAVPTLDRLGHAQLRAWDAAIRADAEVARGGFADAERHGRHGLALAVAVGEPVSAVAALVALLRALRATGRSAEAAVVLDGHREFFATHPGLGVGEALVLAAAVVAAAADPGTATAAARTALDVARRVDQPWHVAEAADLLAVARLRAGDADGARAAAAETAAGARQLGHRGLACRAVFVAAAAGDADADALHAALAEAARLGLRPVVADGLEAVAAVARRPTVAARLRGAAARLRADLAADGAPPEGPPVDGAAANRSGPDGAELDWRAAVAYAARSRGPRARPRTGWDALTPTEREVVALAAQGLSNPAIGSRLRIATGTVRTHLRSVFGKLGVTSRAELAAHAARRGM